MQTPNTTLTTISAVSLAGAIVVVGAFFSERAGLTFTPEVSGALTVIVTGILEGFRRLFRYVAQRRGVSLGD